MESPHQITSASKAIAKNLLELEAVQLDKNFGFTWVSGIQSPIYCDNRKINSDVLVRKIVVNAFVDLITKDFPNVEIIAGVATGGIPFGVLIADRMNLPFIYVRQAQVEGTFKPGNKVVLIEDHISTGGSSFKAVQGLRDQGLDVLCLISIMTYGFQKANELFERESIKHKSLCDLESIVDVAYEMNIISLPDKETILKIR